MTTRERSPTRIGLLRFASTYLLVLVLPLVGFITYYLIAVRSDLEQRLVADVDTRITHVASEIEAELDQLQDIIYFIQVSAAFRFRSFENPIEVIGVQSRLAELGTANRLIHSIAYFPYGAPRVYTSESPRFTDLFRGESGILVEDARRLAARNRQPIVITTSGVRGPGVAIISQIPVDSEYPRALVAIELVPQALSAILSAGLSAPSGVAMEFLYGGRSIRAVGDLSLLTDTSRERDSLVTRSVPVRPGGSVRVVVSSSAVYSDLHGSTLVLVAILFAVLFISLPLIYGISFSGKSPIRQLATLLGQNGSVSSNKSILSTATVELRRLQREVAELAEISEDATSRERREFLEQVLSGTIEHTPRLVERAQNLGVLLDGRRFRVLVGDDYSGAGPAPYERFRHVLQHLAGEDAHVYDIPDIQALRSTFLVSSSDPVNDELIERAFVQTRNEISQLLTVAASREVALISDIPRALLEAKSTLEYRFVHGEDQLLTAEEILSPDQRSYGFPSDSIERLRAYAETLDVKSINAEVHTVFRGLLSGRPTLFVARCVVYEMITAVVESLSIRQISADHYWSYLGALDLADIKTLAEMEAVVVQLASDLVDVARELDDSRAEDAAPFSEIVQEVDRNAFDPMICAKSVANSYDLSVSNFSHQFKTHTGLTFSDFVFERRLTRAKTLLEKTETTVAEIVQETGFSNASSFIRRFRRVTGRTPIEYRRRSREKRSV